MFIGMDVSKNTVDVASVCGSVSLQGARPLQAVAALSGRRVRLVVLEATGGYEQPVVAALQEAGFPVAIVNPRQARDFARALGRRAKTDRIDAAVLARYAQVLVPAASSRPAPNLRKLQNLVARRRQVQHLLTQEKNRRHQAQDDDVRGSLDAVIAALQGTLKDVTAAIESLLKAHWQQARNLLQKTKGVGLVTAATMIADLPELGKVGRKQIAALVGVAPFDRQSGQWKGKSFCSGGRKSVRSALYMATLSAVRYEGALKNFYQTFVGKGKPPKLALNAAMRRLLTVLNATVRDSLPLPP